jgi:hypothetical protein
MASTRPDESQLERFSVFISYARESERHAAQLYEALKTVGKAPYFFPEIDSKFDGTSDKELDQLLRRRLAQSDQLLVVLDGNHLAAPWCGWEVATFQTTKGPDASLHYTALSYAPMLHRGTFHAWPSMLAPLVEPTKPARPLPSGTALSRLLVDPVAWSASLGYPSVGFRWMGRVQAANRELTPATLVPRLLPGLWQALLWQVIVAVAAALLGDLGLDLWERQLALVLATVAVGSLLLAITLDVPSALLAATYATPAALASTWLFAYVSGAPCDGMIAGGVAAGVLVGAGAAARFAQRRAERVPASFVGVAISVLGGLGSVALSVLAFRGLFEAAVSFQRDEEALRRIPLAIGLLIGGWVAVAWVRASRLRRPQLRRDRRHWLEALAFLSAATAGGWLIGQLTSLQVGTVIGMLAGSVGALVLGRARATNARGRLQLRAAALPAAVTFSILTSLGWWSGTSFPQSLASDSAQYGLHMGVLSGMILVGTFGFDSALWGWARRTGDDAIYGALAALVLLPVTRSAIPYLGNSLLAGPGRTLAVSFYVAVVGGLLFAGAVLRNRFIRWVLTRDRASTIGVAVSCAIHLLFVLVLFERPDRAVEPRPAARPIGPIVIEPSKFGEQDSFVQVDPPGSVGSEAPSEATQSVSSDGIHSASPGLKQPVGRVDWGSDAAAEDIVEIRRLDQATSALGTELTDTLKAFVPDAGQLVARNKDAATLGLANAIKALARLRHVESKARRTRLSSRTTALKEEAQQHVAAIAEQKRASQEAFDAARAAVERAKLLADRANARARFKYAVVGRPLGGNGVEITVAAGFQVDISVRHSGANALSLTMSGCGAPEGGNESRTSETAPNAGCAIRIVVSSAGKSRGTEFSQNQARVLGFEDGNDDDFNEAEIVITPRDDWPETPLGG